MLLDGSTNTYMSCQLKSYSRHIIDLNRHAACGHGHTLPVLSVVHRSCDSAASEQAIMGRRVALKRTGRPRGAVSRAGVTSFLVTVTIDK